MNETRVTESPHLTVDQLAERWHTTRQAIYDMRYLGTAPKCFRRGKNILFPLAAVEAHEAAALAADTARSAA